jgi:hypothetical protein
LTFSESSGTATFVTGAYGKGRAFAGSTGNPHIASLIFSLPSSQTRVIFSCDLAATYESTDTGTGTGVISIGESAGPAYHLDFFLTSDGKLRLFRNGTLLATSTNAFFTSLTTFHHVEIDATVADSGGSVVVKINGVTEINYTGDTRNGGAVGTINTVRNYSRGASTARTVIDNVVIQDTTGSAPYNAALGPVIVDGRLRPSSDVTVEGAPSTGANYTTVDENYLSMTDYVAFDASEADRYGVSDLDYTPATVYQVKILAMANALAAGHEGRVDAHVSGNTTTGTVAAIATTGFVALTMTEKPGTGSWTPSDVNGLEVTFERTT